MIKLGLRAQELQPLINTARSGASHDIARDAVVPRVADSRPQCQGAIRVHRARKLEIYVLWTLWQLCKGLCTMYYFVV